MATTDLGVVKPVNKGAWIQANAYESLNMVTDSGKVYQANKDVPAATLLTNTEFWISLSGDGITEGYLDSVSVSTPSNLNKILTESEKTTMDDNLAIVDGKTTTNASAITTKIGAANYATSILGGTVKARLEGTTLYLTVDGSDA